MTKIAAQMPSTSTDSVWISSAGGESGSKMLGMLPGTANAQVGRSRLGQQPECAHRLTLSYATPPHGVG